MSLYNKTKEEICVFLEKYQLSDKTRQLILNEFIDGEVLLEFNDDDFKFLNLEPFALKSLKLFINKEKNEQKGTKMLSINDIIKKFKSFDIVEPFEYIGFKSDNSHLKIGQKILLKKYANFFNVDSININSSGTEILCYLKNKIKISEDSLKKLLGITGKLFSRWMIDKLML